MAGNEQSDVAPRVTDAEIWAALEKLDPSVRGEEASLEASAEAEEPTRDIGHGAEVRAQVPEEASASGENAGEEETGQEEEEEEGQPPEEGEPEPEVEPEPEPEPEEPPAAKGGIQEMYKRINNLTARRKVLEAENATLKSQLEKAQPVTLQPTARDPLSNLNTEQEVIDTVKAMEDLREWCMENLDGGEIAQPDGSTKYLDSKEVRQHYNQCDKIIRTHGPNRLTYLAQKARADAVTREIYPELYDSKSPESQAAWTFIRQNPEILKIPHFALIIGDALRGGRIRAEEQQAKAAKNGAAAGTPSAVPRSPGPKLAPRAIAPAPAKSIRSNGAAQLHQRFLQTGSKRDLEAYLEKALGG